MSEEERLRNIIDAQRELRHRRALGQLGSRDSLNLEGIYRQDKKHAVERSWRFDFDFLKDPIEEIPSIAIVHDREDIINAMILLSDIEFPVGEDNIVFKISLDELEAYRRGNNKKGYYPTPAIPAIAEFLDVLIENANVVFDVRTTDFPFTVIEDERYGWTSRIYEYNGKCLPKPHIMDIRDKFISVVSDYWGGKFISGYEEKRATSGGNLSLEGAANLITALSLGQIEFDTETLRKVKCPGWYRDALRRVKFTDNSLPEPWENLDDNIDKALAVLDFWDNAADYYRFSLRLDREDLKDVEKLEKLCQMTGEMIGVDGYLDAYVSGVPAEDILT